MIPHDGDDNQPTAAPRCAKDIPSFWAAQTPVVTACGRPDGHHGDCWPVALAGDEPPEPPPAAAAIAVSALLPRWREDAA